MKPTKGRYRQRIQAICRGSNSYYSEDILISVLLCLVAGSKPLLLKTRSETIHGLSEMLEQMVQDVFGLNCATINCSQISSPGELYYILINRSREKKLRSQVTSIVRANSPTTSLKAPSGFMNTSRATQSSNPNAFVARELSKPLSPANRTERGFSADDRILGDDTNRSNSFRHSTPIERFSDYSHIDRYSRDQNIVTFGGTPERNNPAKPATLREYHQQLSNQHNDSELIPLQHLNERNENETFRQQKHSASLHVTSHAFNFSKKLANVIVLEGLDDINDTIQSALSEILSKGWFIDRNTMCHVPEPFVIIALATPNSAVRLSKHLLDRFYLNYTYDGTISAKSPPHSKRAFIFSYQEVKDISQRAKNVVISPEINRYLRDLIVAIRLNRQFRTGASPRASTDLSSALRATAAIHEKTYVTPELVLAVVNNVFGHRLFSTNNASKPYTPSDHSIISETLPLVWPPS